MADRQIGQLDLNLVLVFDALLKYRNVTRAAASLHVTQSAVSHSLRRLRSFFDDPLFTRSATGVTPTARGLELSTTVEAIASLVRSGLLSEAGFQPQAASRTFTICMTDIGELALLPTLVGAVRDAAPGCTLQIIQAQPSEIRSLLEDGEADIVIGTTMGSLPPAQEQIYGQKLYRVSNIVIAHGGSVKQDALSIDQYCETPHVAVVPSRDRTTIIDQALMRMGRSRRIVLWTSHHLILPHLILAQPSLIATAPHDVELACRAFPDLRLLKPPMELPRFDVFQFWHAKQHRDRVHVWLRNLIAETFQRHHPPEASH